MYDGIKIECAISSKKKWENSLALVGRHSESTGEVLPLPSDCKQNAITFSRIPTPSKDIYTVQGSLHRFFKHGLENDDNYTINNVISTVEILQNQYGIDPEKSKIVNFEFGVNVILPPEFSAQDFQKYIVSSANKAFEKLNPKRPAVGYIAEFSEYAIKIYDKGFQAKTGDTQTLRIEIKVNRTRWLDQFNFKKGKELYLSDLLLNDNIKILGDILVQKISSLILTPRTVDFSKLTQKQRLTFTECRDARSWEEWNSKERASKRKQLARIFAALGQSNPVEVLERLVSDKWQELTTLQPVEAIEQKAEKVPLSSFIVSGILTFLKSILMLFKKEKEVEAKAVEVATRRINTHLARGHPKVLMKHTRQTDTRCRSPP